jgi:hypothetical protein
MVRQAQLILIVALFVLNGNLFAQSIHTIISSCTIDPYSVEQTIDGNYIISASYTCNLSGNADPYIICLDSLGSILWGKHYSNTTIMAGPLMPTVDYGHLLFGDPLLKFDSIWNIEWALSGISGNGIQTSDSGYVIVGPASKSNNSFSANRLTKLNKKGKMRWHKEWRILANQESVCYGVQELKNKYICYGGSNQGSVTSAMITSFTQDGVIEWNRNIRIGSNSINVSSKMIRTSDDHLIVCGWTGEVSNVDMCMFELDTTGAVQWVTTIDGFGNEWVTDLIEKSDSEIVTAGTMIINNAEGSFIVGIDRHGELHSTQRMLMPGRHTFGTTNIIMNKQNTPVLVGSLDPDRNIFITTLDENACYLKPFLVSTSHPSVSIDSTVLLEDIAVTTTQADTTYTIIPRGIASDLCELESVNLTNEFSRPSFLLYPNPIATSSFLSLKIISGIAPDNYILSLRDALGNEVYHEQKFLTGTEETITLQVSDLPSGIYTVELLDVNTFASVWRGKVVKVR